MEYRRADSTDIEELVKIRVEFVTSIREVNDVVAFTENTKTYLAEHLPKEGVLFFLGVDGTETAAAAMACIFQTAPLPSCPSGKHAELLNIYTRKPWRRQGHAKALIQILIAELKTRGVDKIILNATEDGYPLYLQLGFVPAAKRMELRC